MEPQGPTNLTLTFPNVSPATLARVLRILKGVSPEIVGEAPIPVPPGRTPYLGFDLPDGTKLTLQEGITKILGPKRMTPKEILSAAKDRKWKFTSISPTPETVLYVVMNGRYREVFRRIRSEDGSAARFECVAPSRTTDAPEEEPASAPVTPVVFPLVSAEGVWALIKKRFAGKRFFASELATILKCHSGHLGGAMSTLRKRGLLKRDGKMLATVVWKMTPKGEKTEA